MELDAYKIATSKIKNDVDILVWGYKAFPNANNWWITAGTSKNIIYNDNSINAYFDGNSACVVVLNKLYKNKMLKDNILKFNENLKIAEDVEFNMFSFARARKIQFISDKLYNYRLKRMGSLTDVCKGKMRADNHKILFENVFKYWKKLGLLKNNEHKILGYFTRISYNVLKGITDLSFRKSYANELLNLFFKYMSRNTKYKLDLDTRNKLSYIQSIV